MALTDTEADQIKTPFHTSPSPSFTFPQQPHHHHHSSPRVSGSSAQPHLNQQPHALHNRSQSGALRQPTVQTEVRPSPGRRRRRSLGRMDELTKEKTGDQSTRMISKASSNPSAYTGNVEDDLSRLESFISRTRQRCSDHERDIQALQDMINERGNKWEDLFAQMEEADERAYVLSEQLLATLSNMQQTNSSQITEAEETTRNVSSRVEKSKLAVESSWTSLDASKQEIAELEFKVASEEAMLSKIDVANDTLYWLSIVFFAVIATLIALRKAAIV